MIKIILGNPAYPKSESLIIPANAVGIMNKGVQNNIVKDGWKIISDEAKQITSEKQYDINDYFITEPGRLKRRGVKKIYHAVIKKLPNDFVSIDTLRKTLSKTLNRVVQDKMSSITVCGLGINPGELDKFTAATIIIEICDKFRDKIDIKIIDENKEFINECVKALDKIGII